MIDFGFFAGATQGETGKLRDAWVLNPYPKIVERQMETLGYPPVAVSVENVTGVEKSPS